MPYEFFYTFYSSISEMNVWGDFYFHIKMSINFIYVCIFWDTVDRLNNIDKYEPIIERIH